MMPRFRRRFQGVSGRVVVISALLLGIAVFAAWLRLRDPFYASPRAERDDMESVYLTTWDNYLTAKPPPGALPAVGPLPRASVLRYPRSTVVNLRQTAASIDPRLPTPIEAVEADSTGLVRLPGGGTLRLAALAVSVPKTDDPLTAESDTREALNFRNAEGGPVGAAELDALGVPADARTVSRAMRWFPMVRLVFRSQALAFHRVREWRAFDVRTQANITQALDAFPTSRDDLLILDTDLSIWHDAPILVSLELPCGPATETALNLDRQAEVALAPHARFQLVDVADGRVLAARPKGGQAFHLPIEHPGGATTLVHRVFPQAWADHVMLRASHNSSEDRWLAAESGSALGLAAVDWPREDITGVSVVFLPHKARALFRLPALTELPNPRYVGNLFDVRIPRLYLPKIAEKQEGGELAWILLNVIAGATETEVDHFTGTPVMEAPDDYWPKLFQDVTPRELVAEYQRYAADPYIHVSRTDHQLRFHRPEPWTLRVKHWWHVHGPDWLK